MKLASFNVQNLFHRDKSLLVKSMGKNITDWTEELDHLMKHGEKEPNDYERIRELSFLLGFERNTTQNFGLLRRRNGELYLKQGSVLHQPKAAEHTLWQGWMPIRTTPISKKAVQHKAMVIAQANPDILLLQEVEDKASLNVFLKDHLYQHDILPYAQCQVLEGNDSRGLAFAVALKEGYCLEGIKSYGHFLDRTGRPIFERDCQEYRILTPRNEWLTILCAQFSNMNPKRRKLQSQAVATIYEELRSSGYEHIVVCGTFYEPSFSDGLRPLFSTTDVKDISKHQGFKVTTDTKEGADYYRLGAYRKGVNLKQRDYLLYNGPLAKHVMGGGMERMGIWPSRSYKWPIFSSLKQRSDAASEHPLLWMELSPL